MTDQEIHEVLVAARNTQERRGYLWGNGDPSKTGPCCPGACIAEAIGIDSFIHGGRHPAGEVLAHEFGNLSLSSGLLHRQTARGRPFTLEEILSGYDRAIAKTAPSPPDPHWSDLIEEAYV